MGADDEPTKPSSATDVRFNWISDRTCSSLKVKEDSFQKLLASESRPHLTSFLEDPDVLRLMIYMDGKDLAAAVKPPAKFKRKTVYFIKNQKTSLNAENIKKNVTYGDFAESPLETLSALSQEVILPVLSNPMNRSGWPDVVSKEVTENLHKFIANVFVTIGQVKGQTLLPLPPSDIAPQEPVVLHDKDKIHILEGAVITWTRQIKDVLKADSESALKEPNTYPGPLTEVDFWTERAANLNSIHQQLSTERVKKVAKVLELVKSTYYPAFNRLLKDVNTACLEANDTVKYLKPLRKYLEKMNSMDDFTALIELFKPMFHTMLLIWKHSGYYNTSAKMVTLIREMCNDLIMQACKFVPGPELMQMEPQEAVDKLRQTVRVLSAFKSYYFDNKARTLEETPNNPWKFQNSALFGRLDTFLDRCNDVLNLSQTALQFHKLERVEVGGTKGKTLTNSVKQIFTDFQTAAEKFQKLNYDAMNVDATQFADDFAIFCGVIRELERRLGAVIAQAFDDCTTVASIFKLLDSFEGLLDRGVIAADLERKHLDLVSGYGQDLKEVADMFRETKEDPPLNKNAAPHSGRVTWVRGLKERVAGPMEKLHSLPKLVLDSEEARSVQQQYDHLIVEMDQFEKATVEDWCNLISAISDQKLKQPLMSQDPQGNVLRVNFDPALVRLLRETRYFLLLPELPIEIPANALKIYERDVMFRQQVGNLQLIVGIYNNVQATILPVEKPLITQKLEAVDAALKKGLQTLNWNSHHIDDYIMEVMALVRDVNETLATVKGNVKRTSEVLAGWVANPMFDRKEGKVHTYEELTNSFRDVSSKCHSLISDGGKEITKLLSSSNRTLKVSKGAPAWKAYVDYIGDIVIDGLVECIIASVHRLTSQVDPENMAKHEIAPLLEIQLELIVPDIVWIPELGSGGAPGVRDMFSKWFKSFLEIATLIKRLDTGEGNYAKELEEDYTVYDAISEVQGILGANEIKCNALKAQYSKYGYLWKRDLNETLKEFLVAEGKQLEDGTRDDPTLDRFEAEIAKYRAVQEEIQALPTSATIGYIKIDAKPIKQALTTWVTKWIYLFTHYLQIKVVSSMEELYKFMNQSNATLDLKVGSELATEPLPEGEAVEGADSEALKAAQAEENRKSLYSIMSCMRDVRKRSNKTDNMFEPLRDTVSLLTKFSITMTDVVLKQLEEGPLAWKSLKKKMFQRREILAPLQQAEAIDIRRKSDSFGEKVEDFRKFFQQKAPFSVPGAELKLEHVRPAYLVLDAFHHGQVESRMSVTKIMADSEYLRECQDLFELYVSDYIMLTRCKEELGYLKALWDMVGAVMFTFTDWYATLWDKIDVDFLVEETKKLTKDIKQLNKAVRNYEVYRLLEERLKAMLTSLPLVSDLHHPAMRERHWKQLMKATGKNFIMDSKFNLGNLLELGLHNYVDACSEIVDRAQKELIIEKALKKIDETWSSLSLTFSPYQDTDNVQMTVEDSITEALETDNLALQTMSGGKYVQGNPKFLEIVTNWQKKLGTVDVVLNTWLDVQKKWQALESIFVGSADIRVQLPEDSKRFDVVNADFQDLMKSAPDTPNVVEACNLEGRQERLDGLLSQLEMCEKALQDYLETKRVAFPRFYFVAPADLLDILSKGSNPQLILRHLPKCFDNVHNLEFRKDEAGDPSKGAIGMYSGEGEYVAFAEECSCDGPVESWLQNVVDAMRAALSHEFKVAIPAYDEKPRTKWIFDYSVQNTIMVSRTFFTQDVNEAFEELEEGNEDALKGIFDKQVSQLADLITIINGELTKNDRKKLITLCTIDVHARDVVQRLIEERVENQCYITLTQAQRLVLGGAPAGPAGTGKTESTKDLARALGVQCYVFNCSDQMDYKAMGQIYKGLAQTGAWGCFDEFNRIPVAVLSVCSTQYKTVLDALRARKERFVFEDIEVTLRSTVMAFITMNPGYPGRAELPESLKALFRPVSMCVPDMALIVEIMLMSEGFNMSKMLSRKFVILYRLCEDLLSKSKHYDWKLRAIKTTLYVAGGMKRSAPDLSEDKVLLRALRDFNLGKLTADDTGIFMGLLNDLFPKTVELVPRAIDREFEPKIKEAALELGYQADETFCLKISQLREIFVVRWSVFLLGPAGCGKSAIWKTLMRAQQNFGEKTFFKPINPKAVTRNELYGYLHPSTRWKPAVDSWIEKLDVADLRPLLSALFSRYVDPTLEYCRRNFKYVVPIPAISQVMSICKILESILPQEAVRGAPPPDKKLLEHHFPKWWISEYKNVQFPEKGMVFDYYVDDASCSMVPWENKVPSFSYMPDNFSSLFVPTVDTTRLTYFLDTLIAKKHYVMFVGNTGTGKTAIMRDKLKNMDSETMAFSTINMNSFSDAPSLQGTLEQPLEKKSGVRFGPPGSKRLVYFVDDMNMPFVDKYDTQSAIELIRQSVDYRGWFDKVKIVLKEVTNTQYCACMNPTAGSFNITPRMQRHFVTFAVQMPHMDIVRSIYCSMVEGHLNQGNFDSEVIKLGSKLVDASIELHRHVMNNFLPSAVKFHYQFNLRELSNITQGLLRMTKDYYREPVKVVRLWVHECERVLADRMINDTDMTKFNEFRVTVTKKYFDDVNQAEVEARPLLYNNFMTVAADDTPIYNVVPGYEQLRKTLNDKLAEYNESNAVMDLVLFQQAMEHICRITRIISLPTGNAMLVGVGGSGKQSLARLASFICGYEVFQIAVSSSYGVADFKENLLALYTKAGVKGTAITFLMTDNQIVNEKFLVYINDLLSTGYIADLCTQEDKDTFCNSVRGEVKQAGMVDSADNCWDFFIDKVRKFLHVVLCFSPVGDKFRIRAPVPCPEALVSVATRFLVDIPAIEADTRENIAYHMAFAHQSVAEASRMYLESVRRYNYTTPKSYLELISLYKDLLARKREELRLDKERLENGVTKIAQASAQVADLQVNLKQEQIIVEEKKAKTGALIETIGQEKAVVDEAVEAGREDEEAAAKLQAEVTAFADECTRDLAAAEPVIKEAEAALNSLDKGSLGELKSFGSPAAEVVQVVSACIVLTAPGGKIPKDLSWNAGKKMMGNVDAFLKSLLAFDKDNVPVQCVEKCEKDYLSNPNFNPDYIRNKSGAAAGLCGWVVNICKYFRIYQVVAPKRAALAEANKRLDGANKKLTGIRAKVKELKDRVASLEDSLMKATEDKNNAIAQAEKTATKAKLADRLINGLSGENKRWNETIAKFGVAEGKLVGDVLLAAAFVSYAGPFNMEFRKRLVTEKWLPDITERQIPLTSGFMPLDMLADESAKAKWANEGLMTDPLSVENGAIMSNASRWSLMIDPQLQGIKWIMNRELPNGLKIIQQSQAKYIDTVISCIETGTPLLMENLPEDIDAVLDPVIGKQTIKRGRNLILKIGDNEVEYDQNFRLYLQTKLANPHYKPEIAAQTTLVNFCVTEVGLEEQLLAQVVDHERPDLQEQARSLVRQLGEYTITLKELEDNLLQRLANSQGDILEDIALIENLEETKRTAVDIAEKVKQAKETEVSIGKAREVYRTVATRGSLVYFLIDTLNALDRCYHYSMANFVYILRKGMDQTPGGKDESAVVEAQRLGEEVDVERRVQLLISFTTQVVFGYVAQGLFERHKLIVATQLCMAILKKNGELQQQKFDFLLRGPKVMGMENPLKEWVLDSVWGSVQALKELEDYAALPDDLVGSAKRWQEWMELERPEDEPLPGDWKRMPEFERLLIFRTLRPDRLTAAMQRFVANTIGKEFTSSQQFDLERSFQDSSPGTPIFVFLSPGVDVAASVEGLGKKLGFTADTGHYTAVSLGQGQEPIAMNNLTNAHKNGGWVLLQNIHLTIDWTSGPLEKKVDKLAEGAHKDFRLFLSAEPPPLLERALPISLLQNSIKLTNEPPEGLRANLRRAYGQYNEEMLEGCAKQAEYRSIIFALCYFHAALLERKKFGVGNLPAATSGIGWNMNYPFNTGDLLCCGQCASNYLENNVKVPWDDLRYIFGEIMYGGHIVEDWDRRLANAYLFKYFNETLLEGMEMFPAFFTPANTMTHKQVLEYIDEAMPPETPLAFGLHPNAEIGFKLREAERFCANVLCLQPREAGGEGGMSVEEKAKMVLDDLVERLPEQFDMEDIRGRVDEFTPYVMVAIQESDRMNGLLSTMKRSLAELDLGLKGDLTMTRRNDWPLDKTVVLTEVTKKQPDQIDAPSRDGAFIHGLTLEGARWDEKAGTLDDSRPKELFCPMPVMLVRAVTVDKAEMKDAYQCPVYTTEARFRQEVFTAQLKSKHSWIKWTLAGVCLFLDVV
ncbi:hypothetical protein WJX79_000048 [Trebouxia sp. C0005]